MKKKQLHCFHRIDSRVSADSHGESNKNPGQCGAHFIGMAH